MIEIEKLKYARSGNFLLMAGPCVIESEEMAMQIASHIVALTERLHIPYIFKGSYRKANRSRYDSFTGIGDERGLEILAGIREDFGIPVVTDIHQPEEAALAASYGIDMLQIPAFLCRQTDLVQAAARTGKIINLKKGQFLSPQEMERVAEKAAEVGNKKILLTERGTTFGYNNLVVDMRSIPIMKRMGYPVLFDATHSVQSPGGEGNKSGGDRKFAPLLARAAVSVGANGLFIETHPVPDKALSDGPNMIPLAKMRETLEYALKIWEIVK